MLNDSNKFFIRLIHQVLRVKIFINQFHQHELCQDKDQYFMMHRKHLVYYLSMMRKMIWEKWYE